MAQRCVLCIAIVFGTFLFCQASNSGGGGEQTIWESGVVEQKILPLKLAKRCWKHDEQSAARRSFDGPVLAYVTPWNARGYDMAKIFRHKFTHISPVWYVLRVTAGVLTLHGAHDVDADWISQLRAPHAEGQHGAAMPKIVPRVMFELSPQDTSAMISEGVDDVARMFVRECQRHAFDGLVLEVWMQWMAMGMAQQPRFKDAAMHFIASLSAAMRAATGFSQQPLELILTAAPGSMTHRDFEALHRHITAISLMTYDYSTAQRGTAGPNAPLPWMLRAVDDVLPQGGNGSMIWLGLNFYGNDYTLPHGGGTVLAHDVMRLLRRHKPPLTWDDDAAEHFFRYNEDGQQHEVWYPTPMSLHSRIEAAAERGAGLSIWEIGQGCDTFFDLL